MYTSNIIFTLNLQLKEATPTYENKILLLSLTGELMQIHLNSIGIQNIEEIKRYSLRQEGEYDILKIYFKKHGRELLARSSKFKFQRQQKRVSGGYQGDNFTNLSEINSTLRSIIKELDALVINILKVSSQIKLKRWKKK
jgi:hypothetical protein